MWGDPETQKGLLKGLPEKGFGREALFEMQEIIQAESAAGDSGGCRQPARLLSTICTRAIKGAG